MTVTTQVSQAVDHPTRYAISADHMHQDKAIGLAETYLDTIIDSIKNQPRSLQKRIGPSEMGNPCKRALLHKLNGDDEPERTDVPWAPAVGSAVHSWLDTVFTKASEPGGREAERWLCEERVTVGHVGGTPITGSTDLYDRWSGSVIDHKNIGSSSRKKYRAHGPSETYRRQAHLYGKGWEDDGWPVSLVVIAFLPREGIFTDTYIWSEPYSRQVAEETLATVNSLETLRTQLGITQALSLYSECDDRWCDWCRQQERTPSPSTTTPEQPALSIT